MLLLGVPLGAVGSRLLAQRVEQRLEREADAAAVALERRRRPTGEPTADDVAAVASAGHRLEVALPGGRRVSGGAVVGEDPVRVRGSAALPVTVLAPHDGALRGSSGGVWLAVIVLSLVAVAAAIGLALLQARRLRPGPMERLRGARQVGHGGRTPAGRPADSPRSIGSSAALAAAATGSRSCCDTSVSSAPTPRTSCARR